MSCSAPFPCTHAGISPLGSTAILGNVLQWQLQPLHERALCSDQSPPQKNQSYSIKLFRNHVNMENFSLSLKGCVAKAAHEARKNEGCNKANLHHDATAKAVPSSGESLNNPLGDYFTLGINLPSGKVTTHQLIPSCSDGWGQRGSSTVAESGQHRTTETVLRLPQARRPTAAIPPAARWGRCIGPGEQGHGSRRF